MVPKMDGQRFQVGDGRSSDSQEEDEPEICCLYFTNMSTVSGEYVTALQCLQVIVGVFVHDSYGPPEKRNEVRVPGMADADAGCIVTLYEVGGDDVDDLLWE